MKWQLKEPEYGDMIRVRFAGVLYHYGVYVTDDEVIQFGLVPTRRPGVKESEVEVLVSDIDTFLDGGFLEVAEFDKKERKKNRSPKAAVEYARSKLGMRGYNLLHNNCEHFATECVIGERASHQSDSVREMFRSIPVVDVYYSRIPEVLTYAEVYPPLRESEMQSVTNPRVRREKYCAWRLLEYALERSFGLHIKKMQIAKQTNGRWCSDSCEFSITHSENLVAVAVSRGAVGVDAELVSEPRSPRFWERILTEEEKSEYLSEPDSAKTCFVISRWTAKEALFKKSDGEAFVPSAISVDFKRVKTEKLTIGDEEYFCSVATDTPDKIKIYSVDLTEIL